MFVYVGDYCVKKLFELHESCYMYSGSLFSLLLYHQFMYMSILGTGCSCDT